MNSKRDFGLFVGTAYVLIFIFMGFVAFEFFYEPSPPPELDAPSGLEWLLDGGELFRFGEQDSIWAWIPWNKSKYEYATTNFDKELVFALIPEFDLEAPSEEGRLRLENSYYAYGLIKLMSGLIYEGYLKSESKGALFEKWNITFGCEGGIEWSRDWRENTIVKWSESGHKRVPISPYLIGTFDDQLTKEMYRFILYNFGQYFHRPRDDDYCK